MPEYGYDDEDPEGDVPDPRTPNDERDDRQVTMSRRDVRALEGAGRRASEAEARAQAAERRLAFAEAGISLDPNDRRAAMFVRGYDGELTQEAIRAEAAAVGLTGPTPTPDTQPPPQPPNTPLEPGEADFQGERQTLATGAPPDETQARDPYQVAEENYQRELADGRPWRQAMGAAINTLANAANRGDPRVIVPSLTTQAIGGGDVGSPPPGAGI